ncbi:MAG: hypothetical protein IJP77_01050 [Bacteroidales bacterium]|nr:hypothetical protein [Bacteroidales bacterium]
MNRSRKITDTVFLLLFFGAVTLYFAIWYGFHTINLEQLQLFEWTWVYFAQTVAVPGGFADYLGRFLTQFFHTPIPGALIIAGLLVLIRFLILRLCRRKDVLVAVLSYIPPVLLLVVMCYRFPTVSLLTSFALVLGALLAVTKINNTRARRICALISIPVLYYLAGSFVLLFAAGIALRERNKAYGAIAILLAVACPLVAYPLLSYPLGRLLYGLHYYKVHVHMPVWPWIAVAATLALLAFGRTEHPSGSFRYGPIAYGLLFAAGTAAVLLASSQVDEQSLKYSILTGKRAWNRIVTEATRRAPRTYSETACLNLALCKTGHLGGHMFDYLQDGPETLLPHENTPHHNGLSTAEIFYQLGMVNNARRYCFEALGVIPDYQKSAPVFKLLAETSIVNEKYELARKYLTALSHTLYYRKWANERLAKFEDLMELMIMEEYAMKHLERYKGEDYIFDYNAADVSLRQLLAEYPGNITALNYLLAWSLLNKDLGAFMADCPFDGFTEAVPKAYQEAFLLNWDMFGGMTEDLPPFINKRFVSRKESFTRDFETNVPMNQMLQRYGDTYWFYYYFK